MTEERRTRQAGDARTRLGRAVAAVWRWKSLVLGLVIMLTVVVAGIGAPFLAPYQVDKVNYPERLQPPSSNHWFGTDEHGRDMFSRILYGARITLTVGSVAVVLATIIGITLGLTSGFIGGMFDMVASRVLDAMFAFPFVFLAISIVAIVGPGKLGAVAAIAITSVPQFARVSRAAIIAEKARGYVDTSRVLGSSKAYTIFRAILPNVLGTLLVLISLGFAYATLNEAALSFLGMGAQSPEPAWGVMLAASRRYLFEAPWYSFFPGACIFAVVFAFNLIADGLRDLVDPRRRG